MVRAGITLLLITLLVGAGVYFGSNRLEQALLAGVETKTRKPEKTTRAPAAVKAPQPAAGVAEKPAVRRKRSRRAPAITMTPEQARRARQAKQGAAAGQVQQTKQTTQQTQQALPPEQRLQVIVSRNIFQAALEKKKPEPVEKKVVEEAQPTKLNLVLLGTVVGDDEDARAIVVDKTAKKQDIYRVGDAVQGAIIETIGRGKVTLDVNGRKESLLIKEREGGGPVAPGIQPVNSPVTRSTTTTARKPSPWVKPHRRISFNNTKPVHKVVPKPAQADEQDQAEEELPDAMDGIEAAEDEVPLTE